MRQFTTGAAAAAVATAAAPQRTVVCCTSCLTLLLLLLSCVGGGAAAAARQHDVRPPYQQQDEVREAAATSQSTSAVASTAVPPATRALANSFVQGMRECSAKEKRKAACLAGECASLQTSNVHTYVICRCPMGRTGKRCEERTVSHDVITWMAKRLADLPLQVRCEHQNVNILAKQGFESSFAECVKYQASKKGKVKDPATRHPPSPRRRTAAAVSAIRAIFGFAPSASGSSISSSTLAALLLPHRRPAAAAAAAAGHSL